MQLVKVGELHFATSRITDAVAVRMLIFNIQAMERNNADKIYDSLISDSKLALAELQKSISETDLSVNVRISKTKSLKDLFLQLRKEAAKFEGIVHGEYERKTATYLEIFPRGLSEYSKVKKNNIEMLLSRLVDTSFKYKDTLGEKYNTVFKGLLADYQSIRDEQEGEKTNVGDMKTKKSSARDTVNLQLQKNLLTILLNNPGKSSIISKYFDLSLMPKSKSVITKSETIEKTSTPKVA